MFVDHFDTRCPFTQLPSPPPKSSELEGEEEGEEEGEDMLLGAAVAAAGALLSSRCSRCSSYSSSRYCHFACKCKCNGHSR